MRWDALAGLQRIEECHKLHALLVGQPHLESLAVEVDELRQVCGGTIVEVRGACREASQDGTLHAIDVAALPRDECFAGIGGIKRMSLARR
jgi:hypothetical protein